jgi:transcriptional regulator with XRE-family HTH domain
MEFEEVTFRQKPIDVIVGANVAAIRVARGVNLGSLASALKTTEERINRYESGAERISSAHLIEICRFFAVNLADMFPKLDAGYDPSKLH